MVLKSVVQNEVDQTMFEDWPMERQNLFPLYFDVVQKYFYG
jgi:hypothetical protein